MARSAAYQSTEGRTLEEAADPVGGNGSRRNSHRRQKHIPGFELDCGTGREVRHVDCGGRVEATLVCGECGETCPPGEAELVGGSPVRLGRAG